MTYRIDRLEVEGAPTVLRVSGRMAGDAVNVLRAAIEREHSSLAVDLEEVNLVDGGVVSLLAVSETDGIELRNCPAYIREWVDQERAHTPSDPSDDSDVQ